MKTKEEWESLTREIDLVPPYPQDRSLLPWMWLSATEGDVDEKLEQRNKGRYRRRKNKEENSRSRTRVILPVIDRIFTPFSIGIFTGIGLKNGV